MITKNLIWHYTDLTALTNIILKHCFWATDIRFVNDTDEIRRGLKALIDNQEQTSLNITRTILRQFNKFLTADQWQYYLISFCSHSDLLTQWMCYGKGEGCAIGFDKKKLLAAFMNGQHGNVNKELFFRPLKNSFLKCNYYSQEAINTLALKKISEAEKSPLLKQNPIPFFDVFEDLSSFSYTLKASCFQHEAEQRLLFPSSPDMPPVVFTHKPHIEINLEEKSFYESIEEIMIAPQVDRMEAEKYLHALNDNLTRTGKRKQDIDVKQSKLPYRG